MLSRSSILTGLVILYIAYHFSEKLTEKDLERQLTPIVNITTGPVQGVVEKSRGRRLFDAFYAIPYARPPVGQLRFEFPEPAVPWKDVLQRTEYGPNCAQNNFKTGGRVQGLEDCLTINVFIPQIAENKDRKSKESKMTLSTMVYIHGGGFVMDGSSFYNPEYFMDEDIILVTFNYRLSSLGFLNSGDEYIRGNMGLRDQLLALQWVQKNIKQFNGDPNKITIFGESAGALSVHLLMMSPLAKGLFQRAILQSGAALSPWAILEDPKKQFSVVANNLGCSADDNREIVSCLKEKDFKDLVSQFAYDSDPLKPRVTYFLPTVDVISDDKSFLPDHPINLLEDGKFSDVPVIFGATAEEALMMSPIILFNRTIRNMKWVNLAPQMLIYPKNDTISNEIFFHYFRTEDKNVNYMDSKEKLFENYTNLLTQRIFVYPLHKSGLLHSKNGDQPVYLYTYSYHGKFSLAMLIDYILGITPYPTINFILNYALEIVRVYVLGGEDKEYGVAHADDLALLWRGFQMPPDYPTVGLDSKDYPFSVEFVKTWVKFAKGEALEFMNIPWESINNNISTPYSLKYFNLDDVSPGMYAPGFLKHLKFLNQLFG